MNFDENTSLFAVYDGHGGCEVAQYCSLKLPNFIKETEAYKAGDIEKALEDAFLGIDATIITEEVAKELNIIASEKELPQDKSDDEEENVDHLYEEAEMPLDKVLEKYKKKLSNVINQSKDSEKLPSSSSSQAACSSSSSSTSHSKDSVNEVESSTSSANEAVSLNHMDNKAAETSSASEENSKLPVPDSSENKEAASSKESEADCKSGDKHVNGEATSEELSKSDVSSSSSTGNGEVSKKGEILISIAVFDLV